MEAWTHSILATSLPTVRESSCEEERRVVKGLVVERYVDRERATVVRSFQANQ